MPSKEDRTQSISGTRSPKQKTQAQVEHNMDQITQVSTSKIQGPSDPAFTEILRRITSTIFQLRVGHIPLNCYLHRFKRTNSTQCPACGHPKETPEHYLLQCPKYTHKRWPICTLAGGRLPKFETLLSSPKYLKPLANFIQATRRFELNIENHLSK